MRPDDFDEDDFFSDDDGNYTNEGNFNEDDFVVWDRNVVFNEDGIAIDADGNLWLWGYNDHGQLGEGTWTNKTVPQKIMYETSQEHNGGSIPQSGNGDPGSKDKTVKKGQTINGGNVFTKPIGTRFSLGMKAKSPLSYYSADKRVAKVSSGGIVTIKDYGTCKIIITAKESANYKKATKTVTVKGILGKPLLKAKASKKRSIRLTWSKSEGADGYQLYFKAPGAAKFRLAVTKSKKVKGVKHRNLIKGKKYSYKIRAYKTTKRNKKVFSKYSKAVTVTVK